MISFEKALEIRVTLGSIKVFSEKTGITEVNLPEEIEYLLEEHSIMVEECPKHKILLQLSQPALDLHGISKYSGYCLNCGAFISIKFSPEGSLDDNVEIDGKVNNYLKYSAERVEDSIDSYELTDREYSTYYNERVKQLEDSKPKSK